MLKIPDVIDEEELLNIVKHTKKKQHKLAWMLGYYQAMRISEVVKLSINDINFQSKLIHIKQSKGKKDRIIPIAPQVYKYLKHLPISVGVRALQRTLKRKSIKVLKKDIHFHTLRHSGLTYYHREKKLQLLDLQRFAGHSNPSSTQIYVHINPKDLVDKLWK
jgi:integrase